MKTGDSVSGIGDENRAVDIFCRFVAKSKITRIYQIGHTIENEVDRIVWFPILGCIRDEVDKLE
jgi:hypothetical protein